jgi:energy-coupling factor transporter ATP-binding protein EcfA2
LRVLDLWKGSITTGSVVAEVHSRFGRQLGKALLSDPSFEHCLNHLYNRAIQEGGGEILLSFDPGAIALAALPWEVTHNGVQPILLTRGVVLNCTRIITFAHVFSPHRLPRKRLRVLTMAPRVQMDEVGRTFEQLARSLMCEALRGLPVDIETLPQNTMDALYNRLSQEPFIDVLDYYGHGIFTEKGGALLLENAQGGRDPVIASRLAVLPNLPSFVALHACQSARLDIDEPLAGIATALSAAGVRAVLAMQLTTRMMAATHGIAPTLYQELAAGKSVQQAVATIRQKLYTGEQDGASWYVPVLYLRQADNEPFVLLERSPTYPPNPFAGEGAFKDANQFMGREAAVQRIADRLAAGGNLSIVGPAGSGKSTLLALIATTLRERMEPKPEVVWVPLQRNMKLLEAQLALARRLGGPKAKATDLLTLLEDRHLILLLDDLGQLEKGERGLEVRLWLRQLSQDRTIATVQLVASSLRPLREIFKEDESPDYSPLHNVMSDIVELGAFTDGEARRFITMALEGTPFQLQDFVDLLTKPIVPRALREACRLRYDQLCQSKVQG